MYKFNHDFVVLRFNTHFVGVFIMGVGLYLFHKKEGPGPEATG